jgi:hypothetical protein
MLFTLSDYGIPWHTTQWDEASCDVSGLFFFRISVRIPDILTEEFVVSVSIPLGNLWTVNKCIEYLFLFNIRAKYTLYIKYVFY